jgi:phosphatidylglycerophosphate synthase
VADEPGDDARWLSVQAERAAAAFAFLMVGALLVELFRQRTEVVALSGFLGLSATAAYLARFERPRSWLPTCITGVRLLLTVWMVFAGVAWPGAWVAATIVAVFALDGLDGWLARRTGSTSEIGGRLDGESDAFLVLSVCLLLWVRGAQGPWVLVAGVLRYAYVLVLYFVPSRGEVPRWWVARYVFGTSLMCLTAGFFALGGLERVLPLLATTLLCASFARSFYWSFRRR